MPKTLQDYIEEEKERLQLNEEPSFQPDVPPWMQSQAPELQTVASPFEPRVPQFLQQPSFNPVKRTS